MAGVASAAGNGGIHVLGSCISCDADIEPRTETDGAAKANVPAVIGSHGGHHRTGTVGLSGQFHH